MDDTETCENEKFLIDTNILVYVFDETNPLKKKKAELFLEKISASRNGYLSIQNIAEFFSVMSEKKKDRKTHEFMKEWLEEYRTIFNIIGYSEKTIVTADQLHCSNGIHFWDALLVATMRQFSIFTIYTENEKDFKKIPELKIINPLK